MVKETEYYDILQVSPSATPEEISTAYRNLAKVTHPDRNRNDPQASEKFQKLNEANEVLSDPEKRRMYDDLGKDYEKVQQGGHGHGPSPEDLFSMFGGMGGMPGMRQRQEQKEHIVMQHSVTLEQLYNEEQIDICFKQKHMCSPCNGEGTSDGKTAKCDTCKGAGSVVQVIRMGNMIQQIQAPCNSCRGSGKKSNIANKCSTCNGNGFKEKDVKIKIPLKSGLSEGQQIQIQNQGHHLKDGKTDLIIVLNIEKHSVFKRENDNLVINIELKLFQALFGFDKIIEHMDKRKLHISHTGKTEYGQMRRIPDEGMKSLQNKTKGDLIITFTYLLPDIRSIEQMNNLQVLLKSVDQEESNKEVEIRVSKSNLVKTLLLDYSQEAHEAQNEHSRMHNVHVEQDGPPQCVHQ